MQDRRYNSLSAFAADWQSARTAERVEQDRKAVRSLRAKKGAETRRFNKRVAQDRATIAAQRSKVAQPVLADAAAKRVR